MVYPNQPMTYKIECYDLKQGSYVLATLKAANI